MAAAIAQYLPLILSIAASAASGSGGKEGEFKSTFGEGQLGMFDQLKQMLGGMGGQNIQQNPNYQIGQEYLQSMYNDPKFFEKFEAPIKRQFEEQTLPGIANRFAGMGTGGAVGSTSFNRAIGRAGTDLQTNLAALRGGMQQAGLPQLMNFAQQPFQNYMQMLQQYLQPTQNVYAPATSGFLGSILPAFAGGFAQQAGQQFGQSMGQNQGLNTNVSAPVAPTRYQPMYQG